ncbi:MAG TPA: hypothetical protein VHB20_08960 [Verrucomicrobiae bacterium]|jgi:hypothetical protein|nr:hypothetical protein [Verrucomicrobiae bacterium]
MRTDWATENLQIIRSLMERSAVYRRALAPVMAAIGLTGISAAILGAFFHFTTSQGFAAYWLVASAICLAEAFILTRRQALRDAEPFWSPPTRRITRALAPSFFAGVVVSLPFLAPHVRPPLNAWPLVPAWMVLYGTGLHAAGFFMPRGVKLFAWAFVLAGSALGVAGLSLGGRLSLAEANWAMGALFGGTHWAYGIYLYFTEKRRKDA